MGCCFSSPYQSRIYKKNDSSEGEVRTFGTWRNNSVLIPDDIPGLPQATSLDEGECLYEAEIDQGKGWRCMRPSWILFGPFWLLWLIAIGIAEFFRKATCDEACCWVRKEYSKRTFFRIYSNHIEINTPHHRWPWGCCGCGSWNADLVQSHSFDRGAFGFRVSNSKTFHSFCCLCPLYGGVVLRQRCPCNGSVWPRMFSDCNGCWCDEWICDVCFCSYKYDGLANPDEAAFAASIALQSYFEGRKISKDDMNSCIEYWKENISEKDNKNKLKRQVCCQGYCCFPIYDMQCCHEHVCHFKRNAPKGATDELIQVYKDYNRNRMQNIFDYKSFYGPVRNSTLCRAWGFRRFFGRRGFLFCTEDCSPRGCCSHRKGQPAPAFHHEDIDDDNDASKILQIVLGDPSSNILINRCDDEALV